MVIARPRTVLLASTAFAVSALQLWVQSPAQAAAKRPDLVVTRATLAKSSVVAGKTLTLHATTKNVGAAKAPENTVTRLFLSKDKTWSKADTTLGSIEVGKLASHKWDPGKVSAKVPKSAKPQTYWVLGCADATKKVNEAKEKNNCRAASTKLTVKAPPGRGIFPQTPHPIPAVTSKLETNPTYVGEGTYRPAFGLDLYAYGSDGKTTYRLHLPGDYTGQHVAAALPGDVDITMTPLKSVSGLPSGSSLLAGVKLEPEGLQLANPGTLTVVSPSLTAANLARQTGTVFNAGGTDLSMTPILPPSQQGSSDPGTVVMSISHFSTPTVVDASAQARQYLLDHPPARVNEQLQAQVADVLRGERLSQMAGHPADPSVLQHTITLYNDYFDHQVVPELNAALTDDKMAATALNDAFRWERFVMVNGVDPGARGDLIATMLPKIVKNAIDKAWARCASDHHISDLITLLSIARFADILGDTSQGDDAYQKALACGHFQVKVTIDATHSYHFPAHQVGTFSEDDDGRWVMKEAVLNLGLFASNDTVPLKYDPSSTYTAISKDYEGDCQPITKKTTMTSTTDGTIKGYLDLDLSAYEVVPGNSEPIVPPGKLRLQLAGVTETNHWHYTHCGNGSGDEPDQGMMPMYFSQAYSNGRDSLNDTVAIPIKPSDQSGTSGTLYDKTYTRTFDNGAFLHEIDTGTAAVQVLHTPQSS